MNPGKPLCKKRKNPPGAGAPSIFSRKNPKLSQYTSKRPVVPWVDATVGIAATRNTAAVKTGPIGFFRLRIFQQALFPSPGLLRRGRGNSPPGVPLAKNYDSHRTRFQRRSIHELRGTLELRRACEVRRRPLSAGLRLRPCAVSRAPQPDSRPRLRLPLAGQSKNQPPSHPLRSPRRVFLAIPELRAHLLGAKTPLPGTGAGSPQQLGNLPAAVDESRQFFPEALVQWPCDAPFQKISASDRRT